MRFGARIPHPIPWPPQAPDDVAPDLQMEHENAKEIPMSLTEQEVEKVANLARLEITPEETKRYQQQLNAILGHAQDIAKLDVSQVPPTAHILPLQNVWRSDTVAPSLAREAALANAPDKAKGCFRVPKIIE